MTVLEAESGGAALQMLASDAAVDVVVSDVLMPEMSEVDFYDRLVVRAPGLGRRVVFLSGVARDPRVHLPAEARGLPLRGSPAAARERVVPFVFHREGQPIRDCHTAWRSACTRAKVAGRLFHDLRRTSLRNLVRAGVPERVAMALPGHLTRTVFDPYHIVAERDLGKGVEKLALLHAQPALALYCHSLLLRSHRRVARAGQRWGGARSNCVASA